MVCNAAVSLIPARQLSGQLAHQCSLAHQDMKYPVNLHDGSSVMHGGGEFMKWVA
jgi:hypothetical protein